MSKHRWQGTQLLRPRSKHCSWNRSKWHKDTVTQAAVGPTGMELVVMSPSHCWNEENLTNAALSLLPELDVASIQNQAQEELYHRLPPSPLIWKDHPNWKKAKAGRPRNTMWKRLKTVPNGSSVHPIALSSDRSHSSDASLYGRPTHWLWWRGTSKNPRAINDYPEYQERGLLMEMSLRVWPNWSVTLVN